MSAGFRQFGHPVTPAGIVRVAVHGGMTRQAPENSAAAIELSIEDGLDAVAVDVRRTRDGQHVLFHDAMLDAKTNGAGPLTDHTWQQLWLLDAGSWFAPRFAGARMLTLEEALRLAQGRIPLVLNALDVDSKTFIASIQAARMQQQVLVRGQRDVLQRVRDLSHGDVNVMASWQAHDGFEPWIDDLRPAAVAVGAADVSTEAVERFHRRGIRVHAICSRELDGPGTWAALIAAQVDLIETQRPEELIAWQAATRCSSRSVRLACHRGAARYAPENTLAALEEAARLQADYIEFDVRASRQGAGYLLHDPTLDRTTDGRSPIGDAADAVIDSLDAGAWFGREFRDQRVPTLAAWLAAFPKSAVAYLDAKDISPEAVAAALAKHGLVERAVLYQHAPYLARLKQIDARLRVMPPAASPDEVTTLAAELKPFAIDAPWHALSKPYIDHCHALGIQVFGDAPPHLDIEGYCQAMAMGIDVILTDHPVRFWRACERMTGV